MSETGLKSVSDVNEDEEIERLTKEVMARKNRTRTSGYKPAAQQLQKPPEPAPAKKQPAETGATKLPAWKQEQLERERQQKERVEREAEEKRKKLTEMKSDDIETSDPVSKPVSNFSPREDSTGFPLGSEENDDERAKREEARLQKMIGGGY